MKTWILKNKHVFILLYFFVYLVWFGYLEKTVTTDFANMHIKLDDIIPFNEFFVIPYMLWFLYVASAVVFFLFTSKEDFLRLAAFLFTGMTICLIIYTIFPNGHHLRPLVFERNNIFTDIIRNLYSVDTSTNVCPSIHVLNSIGVHIGIVNSKRFKDNKAIKIGSFILMVSICLSTVFLKQHSAIDGICSVILSIPLYVVGYRIVDFSDNAQVNPKEV